MEQTELVGMPERVESPVGSPGGGTPRLRVAKRAQVELVMTDLEASVPEDHPARAVWAFVLSADLSPWYADIRAVEGHRGRKATDPRILMALWLYATLDNVGSARRLDTLCKTHAVYQWICGGVSMNYHTLADFRTAHAYALDTLLTQSVAVLMNEGLVSLNTIAQDGKRIRASAGASSFRRVSTLQRCLDEAKAHVAALREELEADPASASRRERAARTRAARERQERVERALARAKALQAKAEKNKKDPNKVRVSTTDPEIPIMKMADGGFRPAANIQYATDTDSHVIVGVDATNQSDAEALVPMHEQLKARYGQLPETTLVDAPYASRTAVTILTGQHVTVYAPPRKPKDPQTHSPYERRYKDTDEYAAFRQRMSTDEAKALYPLRAQTAECINAHVTNRGFDRVRLRSLAKIKALAIWHALAHNLHRAVSLREEAEVTI